MVSWVTKIILICTVIVLIMVFISLLLIGILGAYSALVLAILILEIVLAIGIIKGIKNKSIRGFYGGKYALKKNPSLYYFNLICDIILFLILLSAIIYLAPDQLLKIPIGSFP